MKQLSNRDAWLCEICSGKRVLHLGCVDKPLLQEKAKSGWLLHDKLLKVASCVVGVDLDATGIEELSFLYPQERFIVANAESFAQAVGNEAFDIVLAADIIEHVSNPGLLLDSAASIMKEGAVFVITTPSAFSAKKFFYALLTGKEHNHPEHTFFYSPMTLSRLASLHDFTINEMYSFQWRNPTWKNQIVNCLSQPIVRFSRNLTADELAVVMSKVRPRP